MQLTERPWSRPVWIKPLPDTDPLYHFGFRHNVLYPDDTSGAAESIEGARRLANDWIKANS